MTDLPRTIGSPARAALEEIGVTTLEQVGDLTAETLGGLHGVGPRAIGELRAALARLGLDLREA